jgi:Tfp pilus assembly protein PilP
MMRLGRISGKLLTATALVAMLIPAVNAQTHSKKKAAKETSAQAPPEGAGTKPSAVSRRDPFEPLVGMTKEGGAGPNLPAGKAGLVIGTTRVDGTIKSPEGMLAVVSNPDQRVYFVREGDRLYDGSVEKIGLDGVVFRENSKDAFGKPVEREVTKRIYNSAGEQQ